jgi:ribosomal protein S18 acetylase RimI-like enzyme
MPCFEAFQMPDEVYSITEPEDQRAVEILNLYRTALLGRKPTNNLDELNDARDDSFSHVATYIATDENRLLGFTTYNSRTNFIENIAVKPVCRELGVGKFMVANVVTLARARNKQEIRLRSLRDSVEFYRKLGFDEVSPDLVRKILPLMRLDITDERTLQTTGLLLNR